MAWLLPVLFLLPFCSKKNDALPDEANAAKAVTLTDVAYGSGTRQKADVYLPANRSASTTGVVVLLHGGSWVAGDKADVNSFIPLIQQANPGAAIINMNYTLADGSVAARFPAQLNDIHTLLLFLQSKASYWQISSNYALVGISSGAHLAMMYTFSFSNRVPLKMLASIVGPADLTDPFYVNTPLIQNVLLALLGKAYGNDPSLYQQASPVTHVKAGLPPVFLSYGQLDELVPAAQANALHNKLQQAGVTVQFHLYPNEMHVFSAAAIDDTMLKLAAFYRTHMR